jgi:hypothetical protein
VIRPVKMVVFDYAGKRVSAEIGQWMKAQRYARRSEDIQYGVPVEPTSHVIGGRVVEIRPGNPWLICLEASTSTNELPNPVWVTEARIRNIVYSEDQKDSTGLSGHSGH